MSSLTQRELALLARHGWRVIPGSPLVISTTEGGPPGLCIGIGALLAMMAMRQYDARQEVQKTEGKTRIVNGCKQWFVHGRWCLRTNGRWIPSMTRTLKSAIRILDEHHEDFGCCEDEWKTVRTKLVKLSQ
jgi:hypothetical protein